MSVLANEEFFRRHKCALTGPKCKQLEPTVLERHTVRIIAAKTESVDVTADLSAEEEESIRLLFQIDNKARQVYKHKTPRLS